MAVPPDGILCQLRTGVFSSVFDIPLISDCVYPFGSADLDSRAMKRNSPTLGSAVMYVPM